MENVVYRALRYLKMHFGDSVAGVPNFPAACARLCLDACAQNEVRAVPSSCSYAKILCRMVKDSKESPDTSVPSNEEASFELLYQSRK